MPEPKKQAAESAAKPGEEVPTNDTRDFDDPVNEASDESFPASDPPAWTETTATKDGN